MAHNQNSKSDQKEIKQDADKVLDKTIYPKEIGGRKQGLEPTRYGDWEKNGRCIDF